MKAFTLYVMVGLPGCGKSTWVEKQKDFIRPSPSWTYSTDSIVENVARTLDSTYDAVFSDTLMKEAREIADRGIGRFNGLCDIFWDQTNLGVGKRKSILERFGPEYEKVCVCFPPPSTTLEWDRLLVRLEARKGKTIPPEVLFDMEKRFVVPTEDEGFDELVMMKNLHETRTEDYA